MFDETQKKIIDAAMALVMERGYTATTTKDIAVQAGINECTIFRRFKGKKDIVLSAMKLPAWNPGLTEEEFTFWGVLEEDLISFAETYMRKVTPRMVKISIGLRTPELYPDTADTILEVPKVFKRMLINYFQQMNAEEKISSRDFESLSMMFLSMIFGFVFLDASFGRKLTDLEKKKYIYDSVQVFVNGISVN